ncbi:hypothetical protein PV10_06553 [Exophiala mesophila]|uniref:C2H2-type domain-containing protein n=1 Tax=Exophiala mesophila TaxID=212818 RepID=A0A0D1XV20_EXOME|nr:uncharacterized protein PV10_06553 [Exophiala mesophila]KIV92086.1 hypothetical protein PV10_06553 [Exophiala mesophila]
MGRSPSQGLTTHDFHHQPFVNPLDVFPRSRLAGRPQAVRDSIKSAATSRSPARFPIDTGKYRCCDDDEDDEDDDDGGLYARPSSALNCCNDYHGSTDNDSSEEVRHNSPSAVDCEDCVDGCEDCEEEHEQFNQQKVDAGPEEFLDDCEQCHHDEHDKACHQGECDFSCFDCIDWNEFERDKSLGLSYSVPLLGDTALPTPELMPENESTDFQMTEFPYLPTDPMDPMALAAPLDVPMHHQCFGETFPYSTGLPLSPFCTGPPLLPQTTPQYPLPQFSMGYGCHPAIAHQQQSLPMYSSPSTPINLVAPSTNMVKSEFISTPTPPQQFPPSPSVNGPLLETQDLLSAVSAPSTSRACQWIMPCGTVCGASFASATDLKKHLKAIHLVKGTLKCRWQDCDSAVFASEAALTGHMSKKHLAPLMSLPTSTNEVVVRNSDGSLTTTTTTSNSDQGTFKCTFPGCPKSFMYKQVRDEHVASCHNGNKMYCHICGQFLNGEGSNFKRHMATHRPKHQHMLCKFNQLGCKRRFPRLDNLRRHEACCKFGKKAALLNSQGVGVGTGSGPGASLADMAPGQPHHHHHHKTSTV